jgi:3-methyladenine DNA glycosylase AlkD
MTTAKQILDELKPLGQERYKNLMFKNYGVKEPCFGVKISDLKKIQKRIKKDYQLALDLYDTGNYDAMYLAGLIADDQQMTAKDLQRWVQNAYAGALPSATVAWVAAGSSHGHNLALEWIESDKPMVACAGWATLSSLVALKEDAELDLAELRRLLQRVQKTIHAAPDAVRYKMNGFVIAVGSYVKGLTESAIDIGEKIGPVTADFGDSNCQVLSAPDSIRKAQSQGVIGKKRKMVKC